MVTLLGHTNRWYQIKFWKFLNLITKLWVNYGNVIITNTSSEMKKHIKIFQITLYIIQQIGRMIHFIRRGGVHPHPIMPECKRYKKSHGDIIGAYKSLVSNQILEIFKSNNQTMGKLWQRNYHDHIIRDEQAYQKISNYIIHNPENWKDDTFYT